MVEQRPRHGSGAPNNARFWTSSTMRTTYIPAWEENYISTKDDLHTFSFGRPALAYDTEDSRWKIAGRQGDETSSSSSDDEGRKSRDITPRASVVSLDVSLDQLDPSSRSHLSQSNYYHRGGDFYDTNSIAYSSDTGYDAASSFRSSSQKTYDSRSDISISSSQYTDVHSAANDVISISSSRNSSGSDEQLYYDSGSKPYKDQAESFLSIASTSSEMHMSISSLRFDDQIIDNSGQRSISQDSQETRHGDDDGLEWRRLLGPYPSSTSDSSPRTRLRSVSESASSPTSSPSSSADFDLSYITSGLALSANVMPDTAGDPAELDFVRNDDGGVRIRRNGDTKRGPVGWEDDPSIPIPLTPKRPRAATTTATYSGSQSTPAARNGKTTSINAAVAKAGTPEVQGVEDEDTRASEAGNSPTRSRSPLLSPSSTANRPSLSPLSVSHPQKSLSSSSTLPNSNPVLLDQTEINSINDISNVNPSSNGSTTTGVKRKKSLLLGGLGALGIASKATKSQPSQPMSPVSPESPVSPTRTISGNIAAAHKNNEGADMNRTSPRLHYPLPPSSMSAQDPALIVPLSTTPDATRAPSTPTSTEFVNHVSVPTSSLVFNSAEHRTSTFIPGASPTSSSSAVALDGFPLTRTFSFASVQSSNSVHSFAYDDSFAQGLMFWGGIEYVNMRREWVVRKEKKANADDKENSLSLLNKPNVQQPELDNNGHQDSLWSGMPIGAEEVWNNFLLGRFSVSRDDIYDKKSGSSESNTKGKMRSDTDVSGIGFRKSPQQRLIIKRLRDDGVIMTTTNQSGSNTRQPREDITASLEPNQSPASSSKALPLPISSTGTSFRRYFDSQHPTIVVHRHSKVPAFSISRQHRLSKDSPTTSFQPTSGVRLNVVLLAQRDVQEAFTNTETTKRLGTVLDHHQAVRAAFPEHTKGRKETVHQVKSAGQVELGRADTGVGLRYANRPLGLESVSGSVGTRSAPVFQSKMSRMSEVDDDEEAERNGLSGSRALGQSRENYKRAYGTLDQPPEIIPRADPRFRVSNAGSHTQDGSVPSKPSNILKRLLSSSASSSKSSTINGAAQSTVGSTRHTTPTQPTNSEVSPYVPPWLTVSSREQKEIQRHVLGQLEHSFENVGLLPTKEKKNSKRSNPIAKLSLRKKDDVLSCVPPNSFFMLVPLWPAETDAYSHRLFPFENPAIPVDNRRYLLVFYKELPEPSKGYPLSTNEPRKIFPGFRALARQITYSELQGTGVRVPEHGVSVSGSLEDAVKQMPRLVSNATHSPDGDSNTKLSILGSCYSREAGLEFDPEALIELDLCTVLNTERTPLPPGTVDEMFDSEQRVTVKLTPIGSAVMEMVWVGGLALTSFGS